MIKKLLKYDMLQMKRVWRVFGILTPVIAVAVAFSFRFIDGGMFEAEDLNALIEGLCVLTITFGIAAIIVFAVFNSINVAKCIGRDFFSDVGQLTLTLPVKRDDLFMAKFLNSLIWITVSI
jgi:ABC-type transport system involved in multi-copper enzyme maturation permease subunit